MFLNEYKVLIVLVENLKGSYEFQKSTKIFQNSVIILVNKRIFPKKN
jgi:hypothetical protein